MAHPQEKHSAETSTVASCAATDCSHNENQECHAGEIRVEVGADGAVCGTYEQDQPAARP